MNSKTLIAGIAGGVALFAMGMLIYVFLLPDLFAVDAALAEPGFGFIVAGEIVFGLLMAMMFSRRGIRTVEGGAKNGAILGGMIALGMGLIYLGAYNFGDMQYHVAEVIAWAIRWAVAGAVVGKVLEVQQKEAVPA